jgi:AraC-like DNA-binding protein
MKYLQAGVFSGDAKNVMHTDHAVLSEIAYAPGKADWHYHENAFISLMLQGQILEENKRTIMDCRPGTLLFQHWQEPNIHSCLKKHTKIFMVEFSPSWFINNSINTQHLEGSWDIKHPEIKILFHHLYKESKLLYTGLNIALQALLIQIMELLLPQKSGKDKHHPAWTKKLEEILHFNTDEKISLDYLAVELGIHPVYLCRNFKKYFHSTLGEYLRKIKVERSLILLYQTDKSLTEIAFECGFADQSHFIRCFREINHSSPLQYRKTLLSS